MGRDWLDKLHSVRRVADGTGVDIHTLRARLQRGDHQLTEHDHPAEGPGSAQLLSGRRALEVAIVVALTKFGLPPKRAAEAARMFTDVDGPDGRASGELFDDGETLLVVGLDRVHVVHATEDTHWRALLPADVYTAYGPAIVLPLDVLVRTVRARLTG